MIAIPYAPDFLKNAQKSTRAGYAFCTVCGKPITEGRCASAHMMGEPDVSSYLVTAEEYTKISAEDSLVDYGEVQLHYRCLAEHFELEPYISSSI